MNGGLPRRIAVLGLLVLAGCGGGGDARSLGPVPTGPTTTTTTVPVTSTTAPAPSTTAASRPASTTTTRELEVVETRSACPDVGFAPNSDNLASDIFAVNMPCLDADALVRKVGPQVGAVGGPSRIETDGFVCVRTSSSLAGLPSSDFTCTSGARKVTFTRT